MLFALFLIGILFTVILWSAVDPLTQNSDEKKESIYEQVDEQKEKEKLIRDAIEVSCLKDCSFTYKNVDFDQVQVKGRNYPEEEFVGEKVIVLTGMQGAELKDRIDSNECFSMLFVFSEGEKNHSKTAFCE